MHLNYENPYSRLAQYDELRMRQHGSLPVLYADDMTSDNTHLSTWFPFDRGEGVKLFGQCPNRQGTFQKGASPSSSFICYINDNIALLQSIREASDISCFNFSPVRQPGILNDNQYFFSKVSLFMLSKHFYV